MIDLGRVLQGLSLGHQVVRSPYTSTCRHFQPSHVEQGRLSELAMIPTQRYSRQVFVKKNVERSSHAMTSQPGLKREEFVPFVRVIFERVC